MAEIKSVCELVMGVYGKCILTKSEDPDVARREYILNVLLAVLMLFMLCAIIVHVAVWYGGGMYDTQTYRNNVVPLFVLIGILVFFGALYLLSRKGFYRAASYVFIGSLMLLATYSAYQWGIDVNVGLLFFVLAIVMSSILISSRDAFIIAFFSSANLVALGYLQLDGTIVPNAYWKSKMCTILDAEFFALIFFVIAGISWLSNREIEKSLARARRSEALLRRERDLLEIKVEERTKKLREAQAEKMVQLYRFAEFGRLSSGLFHDLVNPLSAVALNMERIKDRREDEEMLGDTKHCLDSAISATRKMEDMVGAVRKQLNRQKNEAVFSLPEEVGQVVEVLSYKARKAGVEMEFSCVRDIRMYGDAIKFNQVVLNLVANAIDAYAGDGGAERKVTISLEGAEGAVVMRVRDRGMGIPTENLTKIFQPFFTTKEEGGMGIGLSMVKRIVEKDFGGSVALESEPGKGTIFIITLRNQSHGNIQG